MNEKLVLYYSVENGGDGSAYPVFFDTKELAEWHQDHLYEGWGESCTGSIIVNGNNLSCPELQTAKGYYLELLLNSIDDELIDKNELNKFALKFFPNGLPKFTVKIFSEHLPPYYGIFHEDRLVHKHYAYPEKTANDEGVKKLTKIINR